MLAALAAATANAADVRMPMKAPWQPPQAYDWTGLYVGGHFGYAGGRSSWSSTPGLASSFGLYQGLDMFTGEGSYFGGLQVGYDYMFPSRVVLGAQLDVSFPGFPRNDLSLGGTSTFFAPQTGLATYTENVEHFGSLRGRVGYAPANWLLYATGGFAWTYDRMILTPVAADFGDTRFLWRLGWVAGAGVEYAFASNWTASVEYLYTRYGNSTVMFPALPFTSDLSVQQLRAGLNYRFNGGGTGKTGGSTDLPTPALDVVNFHGQTTFVWQGYPAMRSPYAGTNSLPGSGLGRQTFDTTLYAGIRLWTGAELWVSPELSQGFGFANTHGVAGFPSGESYKLGSSYPYARMQRAFIRQTIDLGGDKEKVEADQLQFAGTRTANRLVLTVGKFSIADIFDTNKYANSPKVDFLNWSLINTGTFDYAGDGWGYTYGAAAEWYQGSWTLRAGVFDLSQTPAGGDSPNGGVLDPTFQQFALLAEIEKRYDLWGQPGKIKFTGFVNRGRAGKFEDAIALAQITGDPADITLVRKYRNRVGVSMNLEQRVRSRRLGRRHRRAVGLHRHRPHRRGRRRNQRQELGPAGRYSRHCRDTQPHRRRSSGVFQRRRPGRPDRRRPVAESGAREDLRGLLQLRPCARPAPHLRLPVHRQSRLQHRSRPGERVRRPLSRSVLEHDPEKWVPVFGQRSCSNKKMGGTLPRTSHVLRASTPEVAS
jgi:high affinity Mn2+ porin